MKDRKFYFSMIIQGNTKQENGTNDTRTVQAGTISKTITVTQFDEVSELFNPIKSDGSCETRPSTEYNHPLAQWAMELSEYVYNPLKGIVSPAIPGLFMVNKTKTAIDILNESQFEDVKSFNTSVIDTVSHVIAHKSITFQSQNEQANYNVGGIYYGYNNISDKNISINCASSIWNWRHINNSNWLPYRSDSPYTGADVSSQNLSQVSNRELIVVVIRGSETLHDWMTDVDTEFDFPYANFELGKNDVLNSLYHGTGDIENCTKCNGNSNGCEYCKGYIPFNNISNPIFLITGHSLGAAVADLVANHLDSCEDTNCCSGSRTVNRYYTARFLN